MKKHAGFGVLLYCRKVFKNEKEYMQVLKFKCAFGILIRWIFRLVL